MKKNIMIVDDELDILVSLKTVLEKRDFEVTMVANGRDCLKEIENGYKGVVLIDLMMPDMDGWDTINEIVNSGHIKDVAISVITGKGTKDFQKMSMLGSYIMDYLTKPVDINVLIKSLERSIKYLNSKNKE
jgi:DNA-binding response OmpR family regulator